MNGLVHCVSNEEAFERCVQAVYATVQSADRCGGISGPTIVYALTLIHRITEVHSGVVNGQGCATCSASGFKRCLALCYGALKPGHEHVLFVTGMFS